MRRRVAAALALTATAAIVAAPDAAAVRAEAQRPNVLVVITDDQRFDGTLDVMPHTEDWLGRGGTTFTHAFATTPLCCPSRASVMTGLYAHNHGVTHNYRGRRIEHDVTIQRRLHDAGYLTALSGKYLNAWPVNESPPYFDRWAFFQKGGYRNLEFNVNGATRTVTRYSTGFVRNKALDFLHEFEGADQRPWYLYVAPFAPHGPPVPSPYRRGFPVPPWDESPAVRERDTADKPPFVQSARVPIAKARSLRRGQLRALLTVDQLMEDLRLTLEELGEDRDTLVIFLSDNGIMWHEHGIIGKRVAYTDSVRIPLLVAWPGRVAAGAKDDRIVATIDVAPTILEAAGIQPDPSEPMDGKSLLDERERSVLLFEHWRDLDGRYEDWASIRTKSYQYVEYYGADHETVVFREYYDLESDPWQLENLFADGNGRDRDPDAAVLSGLLALERRCRGAGCS